MADECDNPEESAVSETATKHHGSPEGKVVGALEPTAVDGLVAALEAAGFPAAQIDVITADELDDLDSPREQTGIGGLVERFLFSVGNDLTEIERMRTELADGHVLVGVAVTDEAMTHRVRDLMREHGGHGITHFGRWTIRSFA